MGIEVTLLIGIGLIVCIGLIFLCIKGMVNAFRSGRKGHAIAISFVLGIVALLLLSCGACFGIFFIKG